MNRAGFIVLIILLGIIVASCKKEQCLEGDEYPRGSQRTLAPFTAINVNLSAVIELIQDTTPFVEIVAEENLETHLATRVLNETLDISLGYCFSKHANIILRVHYDTLNTIIVSGPGDVYSKTIMLQNDLNLLVKSSGDIFLTTNARRINSTINGTGVIKINGQIGFHTVVNNNSGNVNTYQAMTDTAVVNLYGTGSSYLRVKHDLTANIFSNGDLYFKGRPHITENISGSGSIINEN
jgi:hypothetical protein